MSNRREIEKILSKIDKIAKKGKDGIYEYYDLIDDLINQGKYYLFDKAMFQGYNIDINVYNTVDDVKKSSFPRIRFNTNSKFQEDLKLLHDAEQVYQIGLKFYSATSSVYLGTIKEVEKLGTKHIAYKDPNLFKRQDEISVINLECFRHSDNEQLIITDTDVKLLDKYSTAINFLKE